MVVAELLSVVVVIIDATAVVAISGVVVGLVTLLIVDLLCPRMKTLIAQL